MKYLVFYLFFPLSFSCLFYPRAVLGGGAGPYIDSVGYHAARARLETLDRTLRDSLLAQALAVQEDSLQTISQTVFFESIEDSYQRYLKLFANVKRSFRPEIRCKYDLVETFNFMIFDPQPFINAMLHTMSLTDVVTLDFRVEPKSTDTTLMYVALTKTCPHEGTKGFTVSDEDLILALTRNGAVLMTARP